ncbi:sensor histidine kinase [Arsenicibacter rosenii]|uniref:histidine kinase n=1 Tax=Arsenicibacter rosenii TaxID=1750698 RepID=A0A1S2VI75_9BACT|nr:ATP-binding protein [Arsenicibacter rosenii]OIN57548.1 hypothetical protein BLX24_18850 [Arsenicibacter rosenii]
MKSFLFILLGFVCCLGAFSGKAQPAIPTVDIQSDSVNQALDTTQFQILEDRQGMLRIEQVVNNPAFHHDSYFNRNRRSHVYWIRLQLRNTLDHPLSLYLCHFSGSYFDLYWQNRPGRWQHQRTGPLVPISQIPPHEGNRENNRILVTMAAGQTYVFYQRLENPFWQPPLVYLSPQIQSLFNRKDTLFAYYRAERGWVDIFVDGIMLGILMLAIAYNVFLFLSIRDRTYLYFGIALFFFTLDRNTYRIQAFLFEEYPYSFRLAANFFFIAFFLFFLQSLRRFTGSLLNRTRNNRLITYLLAFTAFVNLIFFFSFGMPGVPADEILLLEEILVRVILLLWALTVWKHRHQRAVDARLALIATTPLLTLWVYTLITRILGQYANITIPQSLRIMIDYLESFCFAWLIILFSGALINRYNQARQLVARQALEREQLEKEREMERNRIIASQNERLEQQVKERTAQLEASLTELKATQAQLIQAEKMASLGELTAGIAHEIQNPLNFVNNFAEVSVELIDDLKLDLQDGHYDGVLSVSDDLAQILAKIQQHGQRAAAIVSGMLDHSRTQPGAKTEVNINELVSESLKQAYHDIRTKDSHFRARLVTNTDRSLPRLTLVAQDISRTLVNLFTNAFYAMHEKAATVGPMAGYEPQIRISTEAVDQWLFIRIRDNGTGIDSKIIGKVFQPFFTTKPTGHGTGMGLSLSYDIITKGHGGQLSVISEPGNFTEFTIQLPLDDGKR